MKEVNIKAMTRDELEDFIDRTYLTLRFIPGWDIDRIIELALIDDEQRKKYIVGRVQNA